jgi:hypothetical protein
MVLVDVLATQGETWVRSQRARFRPHAGTLEPPLREQLGAHFDEATLESARFARTDRIEKPDFLQRLGRTVLDFARMQGITYVDTVVISDRYVSGPISIGLAFHELVHVVQYEILGTREFVRRYVQGWVDGGYRYEAIPLERMAYELQRQFHDGTLDEPAETTVRTALEDALL